MNKLLKRLTILSVLLFGLMLHTKSYAHAVQLGYCTSCNGDLRIWIEHWHNTENPSTTTVTMQLNVNGNITTITGSPDTSVINVPYTNLPGCFTPITIYASCPNDANQYNDWVAYDFNGLPCGVPISVTIISGNTVFTDDCGGMYPASTGNIIIPCQTNQLPDVDTCAGNTIGPFNFPAGNTWTNDNPNIGLPASGSGNIPAFTPASVNNTEVANIVVTNSCGVSTFAITVYPAPHADFTPLVGCPGTPVAFTNNTTMVGGSITGYVWDFGDGSPQDTSQNPPPHVFPAGGPFNVTLTVNSNNGCTSDTTILVDPMGGLVANFTAPSLCDVPGGSPTIFTDASNGNITNWQWDFDGDGIIDDTIQNPTHTFPGAGTYMVYLHIDGAGGCVDSVTLPIYVNPTPIANFSVPVVCFPIQNTYIDSSYAPAGTNYAWDFGDAIGTSTATNPTYNYAAPGAYYTVLTLTTDSGCTSTHSDTARTLSSTTAAFTTNDICSDTAAVFIDQSTAVGGTVNTWQWDFDGDGIIDNTNQNPTFFYPAIGLYNVQLIVSLSGSCADTVVQPINVNAIPTADFSFVNACFGTAVSFTDITNTNGGTLTNWNWNFGNSNTSIVQNPAEMYGSEGVYNVELIVTGTGGCSDTVNKNIEVWPIPVANFSPNEVCLNAMSQFNDLSTVSNLSTPNNIAQWQWTFGDGFGLSLSQNPTYAYNSDGLFPVNLNVISNHGCSHDTTIDVTVNPLPQISFGNPTAGCAPNMCVTFVNNTTINNPGSITSWQWDFGDGSSSTNMNPTYCYQNNSHLTLETFDVTLTAVTDKQCTATLVKPQMITVFPKPLAYFSYSPEKTDIYDKEITFYDESLIGSSWTWDLGDGTGSNVASPVHEYPDSGTYVVTLYMENIYGCKDTAEKTVIIDPAFTIWIPNTFTPDGDGINDYFFATGFGIDELHTLIFDRWGALVFEGSMFDSKWDGTYKGKMSPEDVYVYRIEARDVFNEWHEFIGRVTLLK